jgi:acyl-CoA synthetase (AMP-forming)/AMP-acid ligase II
MVAVTQGSGREDVLPGDAATPDAHPACTTLAQVLRRRATLQPARLGYRFLPDGDSRDIGLTYGALDRRARRIAALLQGLGASGERTLLVYPPGLEFVCAWFGCAYAGAIPVVVAPPHRARERRFQSGVAAILGDARPAAALTTSAIHEDFPALVAADERRGPRWCATDGELHDPGPEWREPAAAGGGRGSDVAFLQYTSGATTTPRGVMVTHDNLMHNLHLIRESSFWRPTDQGSVSWLPPYHDMGLIGGILAPLYLGSPATLMPPLSFVQRPLRWLSAITRFRASASGGPNFAYDLCVRKIPPEQRAGLDLSSWRVAFNGAEPVNARTMGAFAAEFGPWGFRPEAFTPCYGLAESTLLVAAKTTAAPPRIHAFRHAALAQHQVVPCDGDDADARAVVSCGRPVATTVIVDPASLRRCPPERVGEVWVSGPSVASGYWDRPLETDESFRARLADGSGPFLRTGDLGFLLDGELFVTGRLKDLIIVDGANHYPQDVERTVGSCHPALDATDCAAFAVDLDPGETLVVVAAVQGVPRDGHDHVRRAIRTALAEQHDLRAQDIVLVRRGAIPRTSSGKLRRHACRAAYLAGTLKRWSTS